jgi:hypothetical protein
MQKVNPKKEKAQKVETWKHWVRTTADVKVLQSASKSAPNVWVPTPRKGSEMEGAKSWRWVLWVRIRGRVLWWNLASRTKIKEKYCSSKKLIAEFDVDWWYRTKAFKRNWFVLVAFAAKSKVSLYRCENTLGSAVQLVASNLTRSGCNATELKIAWWVANAGYI